jgi:methyl-accepting chemotaxis protein
VRRTSRRLRANTNARTLTRRFNDLVEEVEKYIEEIQNDLEVYNETSDKRLLQRADRQLTSLEYLSGAMSDSAKRVKSEVSRLSGFANREMEKLENLDRRSAQRLAAMYPIVDNGVRRNSRRRTSRRR